MRVLEGLAVATGVGLGLILLARAVRGPRPAPAALPQRTATRCGRGLPIDGYPLDSVEQDRWDDAIEDYYADDAADPHDDRTFRLGADYWTRKWEL